MANAQYTSMNEVILCQKLAPVSHTNSRQTKSKSIPSSSATDRREQGNNRFNKAKKPHQSTEQSKNRRPVSGKPKVKDPIIVLFNKPFDVLCQFTDEQGRQTLKDFIPIADVYAAGRLDRDSEGLLLLTNDGKLQSQITEPKKKTFKTYWAQVEGKANEADIDKLRQGVELKDGMTLPAKVNIMTQPNIWPRTPPIRERKDIPTTWLEIQICEGRNRQVRRMTANIGFPTLRLIRYKIGQWSLDDLKSGEYLRIEMVNKSA